MFSFKMCSQQFLSDKASTGKLLGFAVQNFLIRVTDSASAVNLFLTFIADIHTFLNEHREKHCILKITAKSWSSAAESLLL